MAKVSAGLLLYRRRGGGVEVFLVHPGGPFWAKKDAQAWSIPKGEYDPESEVARAAVEGATQDPRGDGSLVPLPTPGHTPGSCWYASPARLPC